jgi:hypothetical protein
VCALAPGSTQSFVSDPALAAIVLPLVQMLTQPD